MKYKIGELAKLLNISTNTVRRYENQGYIHAVRNEDSGYRYYDEDGVFDITNIRLLRKYGYYTGRNSSISGTYAANG